MAKYQPHDRFYRRARERGLVSRAAFKIEELVERGRLVRPGARIVDLGCAPGGWLKILARAAGPSGRVVGVDLAEVRGAPPGVVTIAGDIADPAIAQRVLHELGGPADLVTSDLAPKLSGIAARDEARAGGLVEAALAFADSALRPGGTMVAKVFMGGQFKRLLERFEAEFEDVEATRVEATRPGSSELYVVARQFRRSSKK
jgi:23S rRNA (uridine2552-2'-O)-methyltransferase